MSSVAFRELSRFKLFKQFKSFKSSGRFHLFQWFHSFQVSKDLFSLKVQYQRRKLIRNSLAILLKGVRLFERFERLEPFEHSGCCAEPFFFNSEARKALRRCRG